VWLVMISLHAAAAIASFATGSALLNRPARHEEAPWLFRTYFASLCGMVVFMGGAMLSHWSRLAFPTRVTYVALFVLGIYMVIRAVLAHAAWQRRAANWQSRYLDHVGFTLISLFDGFLIVGAIDLGVPSWLAVVIALLGVFGGIRVVEHVKKSVIPA
jgi:uncharacterized membrane protein YfcA